MTSSCHYDLIGLQSALLLGAILIDTNNLANQSVTSKRDVAAVKALYTHCTILPEQTEFYRSLAFAKHDEKHWESVPYEALLEADYKAVATPLLEHNGVATQGIGISSILLGLDRITDRERFAELLAARCEHEVSLASRAQGLQGVRAQSLRLKGDAEPQPAHSRTHRLALPPGPAPLPCRRASAVNLAAILFASTI
eukprot:SAG11_NODE_1840_length_4183_cov_8.392018_3_plen_197_part_00